MGLAPDDFAGECGGADVEAFADFFANEAVVCGVGEDFVRNDDPLGGGQALEGVGEFVGALGTRGFGLRVSRRSWVCEIGGGGLFCLVLQEGHEQLVVAELLALAAIEAFEQGGDEIFLLLELGPESGVLIEDLLILLDEKPVLLDELGGLLVGHAGGVKLRHLP